MGQEGKSTLDYILLSASLGDAHYLQTVIEDVVWSKIQAEGFNHFKNKIEVF